MSERRAHESLVTKLARYLIRDYVFVDTAKEGKRIPPTRTLAKQYNASIASVAHALEILQAQGMIIKRRGSGCYLTAQAVAHQQTTSQSIGLIIPAASAAPLMADLCDGVEHACRERGFRVMIATHDYDNERECTEVHRAIAGGCKAVILYPNPRFGNHDMKNDFLCKDHFDPPLVLVDLGDTEHRHAQVIFDNYGAGYDMTKWLIGKGHHAIAFMKTFDEGTEVRYRSNHDRYLGYCDALQEHGIFPDPKWIWKTDVKARRKYEEALQHAVDHLKVWQQMENRPTAVLCIDDPYAVDIITMARTLNIETPNDLCVVGFDSHPIRRAIQPPFPSTAPDFRLAGSKAVDLAVRIMNGVIEPPFTYMLPVPLAFGHR